MEGGGVGRMRVALLSDQDGNAGGALLDNMQVGMKKTGQACTVPAAASAKLMYYLDCMLTLVSGSVFDDRADAGTIRKLRDYSNYQALEEQELDLLLLLCILLSPDEFIGKLIFPDSNGALCGTSSNKFYEITAARTRVAVVENVTIGGRQTAVRKIMAFKQSWIENYYIRPMQTYGTRLQRVVRQVKGGGNSSAPNNCIACVVGLVLCPFVIVAKLLSCFLQSNE